MKQHVLFYVWQFVLECAFCGVASAAFGLKAGLIAALGLWAVKMAIREHA